MKYLLVLSMILNPMLLNASGNQDREAIKEMIGISNYFNTAKTWDEFLFKARPFLSATDLSFLKSLVKEIKDEVIPKGESVDLQWTFKNKAKHITFELGPNKNEFVLEGKKISVPSDANLESIYKKISAAYSKKTKGVGIYFSFIPEASAQYCADLLTCGLLAIAAVAAVGYYVWKDYKRQNDYYAVHCFREILTYIPRYFDPKSQYKLTCDDSHNITINFTKKGSNHWIGIKNGEVSSSPGVDKVMEPQAPVEEGVPPPFDSLGSRKSGEPWSHWAGELLRCASKAETFCREYQKSEAAEAAKAARTAKPPATATH